MPHPSNFIAYPITRERGSDLPCASGITRARLCAAATSSTSTTGNPWSGMQGQAPFSMLDMIPTDSPAISSAEQSRHTSSPSISRRQMLFMMAICVRRLTFSDLNCLFKHSNTQKQLDRTVSSSKHNKSLEFCYGITVCNHIFITQTRDKSLNSINNCMQIKWHT